VTLRARWVTLRARWVTLRARWVMLRARWVTLRDRWVMLRARWVNVQAHRAFGATHVSIRGIEDTIEVLPSLQKPKKIAFLGSDGKAYTFLAKPKDDLRKVSTRTRLRVAWWRRAVQKLRIVTLGFGTARQRI
jgi:hypothetical protein